MDNGEASQASLDLKGLLASVKKIRPKSSKSSFANALLNAIGLDDFVEGVQTLLVQKVKLIPTNQFKEKYGTVCAFEVEVEFDKESNLTVIEKDSLWKYDFLSPRRRIPRVFLIESDSIYVVDAKLAVYKKFQRHIDSDNICLQHTCEDTGEVTKVCTVHMVSSFSEKMRSIKDAIPVDKISAIVHRAAMKSLSKENIREICRDIYIISEGESVGKVGSPECETRWMPKVKRLKKVLVEETLDKVAHHLGAEICKGILNHIQSNVQQSLLHNFENIDISLSEEDFETVVVVMGTLIVAFFMPLVGLIIAVFTFVYTVLVPVEINSLTWRNKVADEVYENINKKSDEILRKTIQEVEEMCINTVTELQRSHELLETEKDRIKLASQRKLAEEWKKREIVQSAVDLSEYPSILNVIAGMKSSTPGKKSTPVVKVFLSYEDKDAEKFFPTIKNIPDETTFEFVNVTKKMKEGNMDIKQIQSLERNAPEMDSFTRDNLSDIIAKEAKSIYAKYSNVVSIGMSPILSDGTKKPCITLYCLDKDLIPYGETCLPKSIHDYPCDIREDYVQFGHCENCDVLDRGCSIGIPWVPSAGSAGFLVKSNDQSAFPPIGFLTAAHVAVAEFEKLYRMNRPLSQCQILGAPYSVIHPSWCDSHNFTIVGNVVDSFCGNRNFIGMDAAFVKLDQPRVREHTILETAHERSLLYDGTMKVKKRGRSTKETEGILLSRSGSVSIPSKNLKSFQSFANCYIIGDNDNSMFFDDGDSGSGVFLKGEKDDMLKPLGIAFARLKRSRRTAVCKIDTILQEFNISVIEEGDEPMETSTTTI